MDELVDVAERQLLIHIGASEAFEEAESLHLIFNRDLRDVESDALICGKISRRGRGNNRLDILNEDSLAFYLILVKKPKHIFLVKLL